MLRKAKRFPVIVMLVLITVFLGSLSGCGDSADPLGTGIIQFYDVTTGTVITSVTIQPGSTLTLVVRVKSVRSDGTLAPVIGERVTFTLLTPVNSGGLTAVNDRTAGDGQAMAVYTAGNNAATDSVRATTSNGATATITITKTGGPIGARISTMTAVPSTVESGGSSVITAKVTDGNSNPMMGETVTFTLPVNGSGASFASSVSVATDAGGNAVAIYQAGSNSSLTDIYDTVRGALANGSSNAVVITISAPTPVTPGTPLSLAIAVSPTSVDAGQVSIVTATLTGADNVGVTVTFTLPINNSGATLSASTAITDGAGNAVVTYTAGANNPTQDVSDTVQAAVGSVSSAAAITRTGTLAATYTLTMIADPDSVNVPALGGVVNTALTVTVTDQNGNPVSGVSVNITVTPDLLTDSFNPVSPVTTGNDGKAITNYTTGANVMTGSIVFIAQAPVLNISASTSVTVTQE